ncbi:MAG: MtrB/PioB family outer membrane beta-barrel protein, partial [Nitrospirae bacterium]|nr:MtrB/PioB family outer membrane beta-barrel protein [Nitrospirota bacterium]
MKKILHILIAIAITSTLSGLAYGAEPVAASQEIGPAEPSAEEAYVFPVVKPEIYLYGGYRFVDLDGSARADEYEYLHDAIMLGGEIKAFKFPHRFHLEIEMKNRKDYFGDMSYSYEDIVLFRGINRTIFHNLDNIILLDLNPSSANPGVDVRDSGTQYGIKTGMNTVFLRFKTHDFPFHVYLDGGYLVKEGSQQQRFLLGSGGNNNIIRTSQSRNIDWKTQNMTIGMNSHLGPVEIDISHGEKRFDTGGTAVFFDSYTATTGTGARAAGVYPHNLIPELKGSTNTLKLHTSYTGGLVASATFSRTDRENRDSRAKADYLLGAGEITWVASPKLSLFIKYRHKETDLDNPESVTTSDRTNAANTYTYAVESSITSITDVLTGVVRYRPMPGLTLRADYIYEDIRRNHVEELRLEHATQKNTASLAADMRIIKGLSIKAKYMHKDINNPAYNIDPDYSDEGRLSVSWMPVSRLSTLISYIVTKEKRSDLHFLETSGSVTRGEKRDVKRDRLLGSVTVSLLKYLSATATYSYIHNNTRQDIEYHDSTGAPQIDPFVPDKSIS